MSDIETIERLEREALAWERLAAMSGRDLIAVRAELSAVAEAIGTDRYMDPPDGGNVSLAEQVRRMRAELEKAYKQRDEALKAIHQGVQS